MVTIIHGGHREGLSFNAARYLEQLLQEKDVAVHLYNLRDYHFDFCCGDQPCQASKKCVYNDIMTNEIISSIANSDVLFFFTPTYFNMPPAILKNFIDRCNLLLTNKERKYPQFGAWISGQTDEDSLEDNYKCLAVFAEICEMSPLKTGKIIRVEKDIQQTLLSQDDIRKIEELVKEIIEIKN